MDKTTKDTLKRVGRSIFALIIEELIRIFTKTPATLAVIPALAGAGKLLRSKLGMKYIPF